MNASQATIWTPPRRLINGLLGLTLLLGVLNLANLARDIGRPFGGFLHFFNVTRGAWQVEASTPPWWPAIASGTVLYADGLAALDGEPFGPGARRQFAEAGPSSALPLSVQRDGAQIAVALPVETFTFSHFLDLELPNLINGFGFWLLALAVYRARPGAPINAAFALSGLVLAASQWLPIEGLFPAGDWQTQVLELAWVVSAPFVSATIFHVLSLFPRPMPWAQRWAPWLYALTTLLAVSGAVATVLRWQGVTSALAVEAFVNRAAFGGMGVLVALYLARLLWLATRPGLTARFKRQLLILLVGLVVALPQVVSVLAAALIADAQSYFWSGLDLRYLLLAVPLSFALVILRYQTFQSHSPALAGMLIVASSALAASVSAWLSSRLWPAWVAQLGGSPFPLFFIVLLVAGLFWTSRRQWEGAFNQLLRWEQRSYAVAREVGQQVLAHPDARTLPHTLAQALVTRLDLAQAAVWVRDRATGRLRLAGEAGRWPAAPPAELSPLEADPAPEAAFRLGIDSGAHSVGPHWLQPLAMTGAVEIAAPLRAGGELIGLLGLGPRADDEIFDTRDLEVIDLIAQQAALLLFTTLQVEALRGVPAQIAAAEERERGRLAQELHDTTQQFLGRLPFYLQVSRDALESDPAEAERLLARMIDDVEGAAQTLRHIRHNLAPAQLANSLSQPLLALVEQFRRDTGLETQINLAPDLDAHLSPPARHALYRVCQQALDNVAEHAQAKKVCLALSLAEAGVHLTLTDDGRGSTPAQRAQAEAGGSFGLQSMRARLTGLGGTFSLTSEPGQGTTIEGWLPVDNRSNLSFRAERGISPPK